MGKKWTNNDFIFLKENYPKKGAQYCSEKLNRTVQSIQTMTNKLNIKLSKEIKSKILKQSHIKKFDEYKINPQQFIQINTPEVAYFLGFIWADGSVCKKTYKITLEIIKDDLDTILPNLNKLGEWNMYERDRNDWKAQKSISTSNYHIHSFLSENDYLIKSTASPDKIISKIPKELKHYFFRGLIDGDGHWQNKGGNYYFCIAGTNEQNWNSFELMLKEIKISNYKKELQINKKGGGSILKITNKKDIAKLGDYIYKNYENYQIGLPRKYEIYKSIKEKSSVNRHLTKEQRKIAREKNLGTKNPNYKHVDINKIKELRKNDYSLKKIAIELGVSTTIVSDRLKNK